MSYKFVKITSYYKQFLNEVYQNQELRTKTYSVQHEYLMNLKYSWSNFFSTHLNNLNNDAYEIIHNADFLQKAWALENNLSSRADILLEQIKKISPDVVFLQDSLSFTKEYIEILRKTVPSIKLIIGWSCSPFNQTSLEIFSSFDFVFVCFPRFIQKFVEYGIKVYEINHGFETSILDQFNTVSKPENLDLTFIGSLINGKDFHMDRIELFEKLAQKNINMKLYGNILNKSNFNIFLQRLNYYSAFSMKKVGLTSLASKLPKINKAINLSEPPNYSSFSTKLKNSIINKDLFGMDMYKQLYLSAMGLNIHGGIAGDYAANMRLYEVTGVGSCLITDYKKNIKDFFEPDSEIVTFKNAEECIEKVDYLINNPKVIKEIAKNGQKRVLKQHTLKQRVEQIDRIIKSELHSL